jgi:hypothetical protein
LAQAAIASDGRLRTPLLAPLTRRISRDDRERLSVSLILPMLLGQRKIGS